MNSLRTCWCVRQDEGVRAFFDASLEDEYIRRESCKSFAPSGRRCGLVEEMRPDSHATELHQRFRSTLTANAGRVPGFSTSIVCR